MKPFNLEEAKAGKPVQTRDGRSVRIICFDKLGGNYPIIALLDKGGEEIVTYTYEGKLRRAGGDHEYDLFMVPKKNKGWINIYPNNVIGSTRIYETREKALIEQTSNAITCVEIEWEE